MSLTNTTNIDNEVHLSDLANHTPTTAELLEAVNRVYVNNEITYLKLENEKIDEILRELKPKNDIETKTFNILTKVLADNKVKIETLSKQIVLSETKVTV